MIVESWLNEVADNRSRGTIFSVYVTITWQPRPSASWRCR